YVSVPLDLFSSGPTRSGAATGWTPLTRDGGQQLGRKFGLYDMTSDRNVNFGEYSGRIRRSRRYPANYLI
ncbi:YjbH domain-containing protein, partial [Salmonella enterica]|uniref:YjbH domain-containing protein n=1 Tax=Salmonella enterica TaxID=28901 RepID=UPI00329A1E03